MKLSSKIVFALALAVLLGVAAFCLMRGGENAPEPQKLNFAEILGSADHMEVAAVGLGKIERNKVIDGHLYKNFVQLLRVHHFREVPSDSSKSECQTGARITLYKDTVALGVYRLTTFLEREDASERVLLHLPKVNKFLKDVGVPFRGCKADAEEVLSGIEKKETLTVPKFKKRHGKRDADSSDAQQYEVDEDGRVYVLDDSVKKQVAVTMDLLNELIFPADTALGTPLYEIVQNCDRAEVIFNCNKDCKKDVRIASKKVVLDSLQLEEFKKQLSNPTFETFAGSTVPRAEAIITLFKDSLEVIELWAVGQGFGNIEKHQRDNHFERGGAWYKKEPLKLDSLFAPIKAAAFEEPLDVPPIK